MVEENLSSALVLEDDADWDVRIKSQLHDFANAARRLTDPLPNTNSTGYLDLTYPHPSPKASQQSYNLSAYFIPESSISPYGSLSTWDLLWLGHCGARFPALFDKTTPLGRIVISDDLTVPSKASLDQLFGSTEFQDEYPENTRVVSHAAVNTCTTGYAISLPGAARFLYELAINKMSGPTDMMYRTICEGSEGRKQGKCLSVLPELFGSHRPRGKMKGWSDISVNEGDEGWNEVAFTKNVAWSVKAHFEELVDGKRLDVRMRS